MVCGKFPTGTEFVFVWSLPEALLAALARILETSLDIDSKLDKGWPKRKLNKCRLLYLETRNQDMPSSHATALSHDTSQRFLHYRPSYFQI